MFHHHRYEVKLLNMFARSSLVVYFCVHSVCFLCFLYIMKQFFLGQLSRFIVLNCKGLSILLGKLDNIFCPRPPRAVT